MPLTRQAPLWQQRLSQAVTDPCELLRLLALDPDLLPAAVLAARDFRLRVPRGYVARMRPGDPDDPLLRQVLPLAAELERLPGFVTDPVGDLAAMPGPPGLLHKYHGRVLLIATGACAIHCRYCFRRHFPYEDAQAASDDWQAALAHIAADPSIREVILSGGDPLALSDRRLSKLVGALDAIPHVERLRLHTRLPIVLPERIDDALLVWLSASRLHKIVVAHANHAQEIDDAVRVALRALADTGATLFNQSVLLRGVNDDVDTLADLSETLFAAGVLPYYLHRLDPVQGAGHFDVPDDEARSLMQALVARLPGYLMPRLVREIPGQAAKTAL
ncbi:MAG: EF-P beta-lysylation protein EpmB [Chromatiales bacterium]|nr:EF-P beta-lysylation protein EpmB [Chromatiales bacterium]